MAIYSGSESADDTRKALNIPLIQPYNVEIDLSFTLIHITGSKFLWNVKIHFIKRGAHGAR